MPHFFGACGAKATLPLPAQHTQKSTISLRIRQWGRRTIIFSVHPYGRQGNHEVPSFPVDRAWSPTNLFPEPLDHCNGTPVVIRRMLSQCEKTLGIALNPY